MREIFISWSGKHSKAIASNLKSTLNEIFENEELSVFMSETDIESGTEWFKVIKSHLTNSCCAIIVLTKENINASWILFEAGAMANHEEKRVIPLLFDVDIDSKSPFYQYEHIKFTEENFKKMIRDIKTFCEFNKMTEKQQKAVTDKYYEQFNDSIAEDLGKLKNMVFFGLSYAYPKSVRTVIKKSIFVSSPMNSSKTDDEYKEMRMNILSIVDNLKGIGFNKVTYPGETIKSKDEFEGESRAINENFKELKSVECVLVIYPSNVGSSVLIEIGYAIALTKKIVIFTRNKNKLPFMLREAQTMSNVKIFEYKKFDEIKKRIISNGYDLFDVE